MSVLKNIFLILFIIGVVFAVSQYAEPLKNKAMGILNMEDSEVLGASSSRAGEITKKVSSDIGKQLEGVQKQVLQVTLGDVVNTVSRLQKIPQDINSVHKFVQDQAENVLQSKK